MMGTNTCITSWLMTVVSVVTRLMSSLGSFAS